MFINKRTNRTLNQDLQKITADIKIAVQKTIPDHARNTLEDMIEQNFSSETYQKESPWKARKNEEQATERTARKGILIASSELRNSIEITADNGTVAISSDKDYAKVHNEGLKAGRGSGFTMPKRQFMPIPNQPLPQDVEEKITQNIEKILDKIFL